MHKLTPQPVGTVKVLVVLFAELGLVLGGDVFLFLEFVVPVGEGTAFSELALAGNFPVPADL